MLQCGFYEKEITPPLGSDIPGYFMKRPSTGVLDRLYAKAFAVSDGTDSAVLIEIDAVELPVKNRDAITARIHAMAGLAPGISLSVRPIRTMASRQANRSVQRKTYRL